MALLLKKISEYFTNFYQTALEILEEKQNVILNFQTYCLLIFVNMLQMSGYIFSKSMKQAQPADIKYIYLAYMNEVSTGTFLLNKKSLEKLTLPIFFLIKIGLALIIIWFVIFNYCRNFNIQKYNLRMRQYRIFNQIIVLICVISQYILLIPATEICLSIAFCQDSGIQNLVQKQNSCQNSSGLFVFLAIIAIIALQGFHLLIKFLLQNYQFGDINLPKCQFSFIQLLIQLIFLSIQIIYFSGNTQSNLLYILGLILGVMLIIQEMRADTTNNSMINAFSSIRASYIFISHSIVAVFKFKNQPINEEFFYLFTIFSAVFVYLLLQMQSFLKNQIQVLDQSNKLRQLFSNQSFCIFQQLNSSQDYQYQIYSFEKSIEQLCDKNIKNNQNHFISQHFDKQHIQKVLFQWFLKKNKQFGQSFYLLTKFWSYLQIQNISVSKIDILLEEIMKTYNNSYYNNNDKLRFHQLVSYHKQFCIHPLCVCKSKIYNYSKSQPEPKHVHELIENIFSYIIKLPTFSRSRSIRERIFLKYITFVSLNLNNPLKSYFELRMFNKKYHQLNSNSFNALSNLLSKKFEKMIHSTQKELYLSKLNQDLDNDLVFSIQEIVETDKIEKVFIDLTSKFIRQKIDFYTQVKKEKLSFQKIRKGSQNLFTSYEILRKNLFLQLKQIKHKKEFQRNYILQKILQIYWIVAFGGIKKPLKLQKEMNQVFSLNQERTQKEFNSLNLIKGNIQIVQASITQGFGKIMNKQETQLSNFFGFNFEEFKSISHIKELMPQYVAIIHDELVKDFIKRGHSMLLEESHQVFCLDRSGFFVPITLQLSLVYGITDDLQMNAVLLKLKSDAGLIKGFDRNFFSHVMKQENANEGQDQANLHVKKDLEKINIFFLIPQAAIIILEYSESNSKNKFVDEIQRQQSSIQKHLIHQDIQLQIYLPSDIFQLVNAFQIYFDQESQYKQNKNKTNSSILGNSNQTDYINNFINFYQHNKDKWEKSNCFSQFNCFATIKANIMKNNNVNESGQENKYHEEIIFELSFSDINFDNLEQKFKEDEIESKDLNNSKNNNKNKKVDTISPKEQQDQSQYISYLDQISPQKAGSFKKTISFSYLNTQNIIDSDQKSKNDQNNNNNSDSLKKSQIIKQQQKSKNSVKKLKEVNFNFEESDKVKQLNKAEDNIISPRMSSRQFFSFDRLETTANILSSNRILYNSQQLQQSLINSSQIAQNVQEKMSNEENYEIKLSDRVDQDKKQLKTVNTQTFLQNVKLKGYLAKILRKKTYSQNQESIKQQLKQKSLIDSSKKSQLQSFDVEENQFYESQDTSSYLDSLKENNLINNIIHHKKENMSSPLIKLIIGYTVVLTSIFSAIFLVLIYNKLNQFQESLNNSTVYSSFFSQVSEISLSQLLKYQINLGTLPNLKLEQIYEIDQKDQLNLIQQYLQNVEAIVKLELIKETIDTQIYSMRYLDMSYFLFSNLLQCQKISTNLIQKSIDDLKSLVRQINYTYLFTIIIAAGTHIILIIFTIPMIAKISKFQEVILTVFSRVTFEEVDLQIHRFQCYLDKVQSKSKNWIQFDFLNTQTLEINKSNFKHLLTKSKDLKNSKYLNMFQDKNSLQQKQISSSLKNTKLNVYKYIFLLSTFSLTSIIFVAVGLGVSYSNQNDIKNRIDLYDYNINALQSFRTVLSLSEIALRIDTLKLNDQNFPDNNLEEIKATFITNLNQLKNYIIDMNHYISNLTDLNNDEESQIQEILKQDLCVIYDQEIQCSDSSSIKTIFQQGFLSVLSLYTSYFSKFSDEILKENSLTNGQKIQLSNEYSSSDEYIYLIPQGFNIPNRNFENIFQTSQKFIKNKLNQQKVFLLSFILAGGFIMYLIWILLSHVITKLFDEDLNAVKFLLTCIPHEKQQDDHVNQLLKIVNQN